VGESQVSDGDKEFRGFGWLLQEIHRMILQDSGALDTAYPEGSTFNLDG